MLKKIIINNFKSFKNETVIDFTRTNYKVLENNVSENGILKGMMFVGANASGKSNVLIAIRLLLDEMFGEENFDADFLRCLFSDSTIFSVRYFFLINNKEIEYFFEADTEEGIISEKLAMEGEMLLERMGTTAKSNITEKRVFNQIDNTKLFLRTIYFNTGFADNSTLIKWFEFLKSSIYFNAFDKINISYGKKNLKLHNYIKENDSHEINDFFNKYNFEQSIHFANGTKADKSLINLNKDSEKDLFFKRSGVDTDIPFEYESLGNQTLLSMLPSFLFVLKNKGMFIADEFSSGFHNELERLVVKHFMDTSAGSQMIFVTHSTNLLSTSILRPDQVYSVELHQNNGSSLKRFSDEQPRVAQNMEKMYLSGVFGGLPNYKDAYED